MAATLNETDATSKALLFVKQIVSETAGIAPNTTVTVEAGYSGVIVHKGVSLYVLPAGDHVIDTEAFPKLEPKTSEATVGTLDAGIYLVRTRQVDVVEWNTKSLFRDSERPETSDRPIQGRSWLRIDSPPRFLLGVLRAIESDSAGGSEAPGVGDGGANSEPNQQNPAEALLNLEAHRLVMKRIEAAASETMQKGSFLTEDGMIALDSLQAALKPELQRKMADIGMECTALRISVLFDAQEEVNFFCVKCGSRTRRTLETEFTRDFRFFLKQEKTTSHGHFCAPCAMSVAFSYNMGTLACGWWGLAGIFTTPWIVFVNSVSAFMVVIAAKTPEQHAALSQAKMKQIAEKGK